MTRWSRLRLLILPVAVVLIVTGPLPRARGQEQTELGLLIGADVTPNASPDVMALFYETGMNYARITGGGYGWAIERHVAQVEDFLKRGVEVLLQLGSHYPSADYFQFRDAWLVDQKGNTGEENRQAWAISYSGKNWPQYSYASEETRRQFEKDFAGYLSHFSGYRNVAGICLHNEPGLHWLTDRIFDYSRPAITAFHRWLQTRYGTVEQLNEAWGTQYASIADAEPPRDEPPVSNLAAWLDWRRANAAIIHDFLQWEIALVHRIRPGTPVTTNLAGPLDWWHAWRVSDNFQYTEGMDFAGIDIYPGSWTRRWHAPYTLDMTRGIAQGRPVHVLECETYGGGGDLSPEERAGRLASDVWTYLGHGARGLLLWGLTGRGNFTLTHGEFNPRVRTMRSTVYLARMLGLADYRPVPARVAVVVDPDVYFYYTGKDETPPYFLDKSGQGMYAAARDAGYQADVLFAEQVRRGEANGYGALLLANQTLMDKALADALAQYVQDGGLLIAEAPFAEADEHGRPFAEMPGLGLSELLGIRVRDTGRDTGPIRIQSGDITTGMVARTVEAAGARVMGTFADGSPAVTAKESGKGTAIYLAGTASVAYADGWRNWSTPGLSKLVGSLVAKHTGVPFDAWLQYAGKEALDVSVLEDERGNRLITLSLLSEQGRKPAPAHDVHLSLAGVITDWPLGFWAFAPASDAVEPIPVRGVIFPNGLGLNIPEVDSSLVILAAHDAAPIVSARVLGRQADGVHIAVSVLNLTSEDIEGEVSVTGVAADLAGSSTSVAVAPGGHADVEVVVNIPTDAGRTPVVARLQGEGAADVVGVPVDVPAAE